MALLVVVAISTAVISVFAVSNDNNYSNNIGSDQLTQLTTPSSTNITNNPLSTGQTNKKHNVKNDFTLITIILPKDAQKIATKYIKQPGATAGTPELVKQDNKNDYIVPVIYKSENVGEIDLDAHTGSNIGGAGGIKT